MLLSLKAPPSSSMRDPRLASSTRPRPKETPHVYMYKNGMRSPAEKGKQIRPYARTIRSSVWIFSAFQLRRSAYRESRSTLPLYHLYSFIQCFKEEIFAPDDAFIDTNSPVTVVDTMLEDAFPLRGMVCEVFGTGKCVEDI